MMWNETYFLLTILQLVTTGVFGSAILYAIIKSNLNRANEEVRKTLFSMEITDRENQNLRHHIDRMLAQRVEMQEGDDIDEDDCEEDDDDDSFHSIRNN